MRRCFCISYCANYKWAMALDGIEKKKKISLLFCIYIIVSSSSFLFALLKETKPRIIAHCFPLIFILRYTSFAFTVYCCVFILYIAKYVKKLVEDTTTTKITVSRYPKSITYVISFVLNSVSYLYIYIYVYSYMISV